jgi:hypothetical protein
MTGQRKSARFATSTLKTTYGHSGVAIRWGGYEAGVPPSWCRDGSGETRDSLRCLARPALGPAALLGVLPDGCQLGWASGFATNLPAPAANLRHVAPHAGRDVFIRIHVSAVMPAASAPAARFPRLPWAPPVATFGGWSRGPIPTPLLLLLILLCQFGRITCFASA